MSGLLAQRGAHIAQVRLDDVVVPEANVVGRVGAGFTFVANTALFYGRYSIAWAGVAIAEAALEEMATYAGRREQFGKKLREHQLIQAMIADAVTGVHAGRTLCERVGMLRERDDDEAVMEANIAKYLTSKVAAEVTANAVQVFGGNGVWNRYPVERLLREAKILEIIEGSSQIHQLLISRFGLRRYRRRPSDSN
jgi:alkylation response protein AidB-like acyl-CoA dehydrogenase